MPALYLVRLKKKKQKNPKTEQTFAAQEKRPEDSSLC